MAINLERLIEISNRAGHVVEQVWDETLPQVQGYAWGLASVLAPWSALQWKEQYARGEEAARCAYLHAIDGLKYVQGTSEEGHVQLDSLYPLAARFKRAQLQHQGFQGGYDVAMAGAIAGAGSGMYYFAIHRSASSVDATVDTMFGIGLIWASAAITDFVFTNFLTQCKLPY